MDLPAIDKAEALALFQELTAIPGKSGEEAVVAEAVVKKLRRAGVPAACFAFDEAHKRSPYGGQCGNLICRLPGTKRSPRRLFSAHLDTVPLCVGCRPVRRGRRVVSAAPGTALGSDDRAAVAVILTAVTEIMRHGLPHPPLTLLFAVQEEVGVCGSRAVAFSKLGTPKLAFNWEGGPPAEYFVGATGSEHVEVAIHGLAAHAGMHPERGVSAVVAAALAVAELQRGGWLGAVRKGKDCGTSNLGLFQGGQATNVVPDRVVLQGEIRSHRPVFRRKIMREWRRIFTKSAGQVRNDEGQSARAEFQSHLKYESFRIKDSEPCVREAVRAIRTLGLKPRRRVSNGGFDANWLAVRGLPTVTLCCGQRNPHTVDEYLDIDDFLLACRLALKLATGLI